MKNRTKVTKFLPLFVIFLSILFVGDQVDALTSYGITSIQQSPSAPVHGENLTVTVVFYDTTNISYVQLLICTLTPNFLCESPITMVEQETGTYAGIFLIEYEIGTTIGYHIKINYDNDTAITVPERSAFLDMDVIEPLTDFYYFDAGTVQAKTDSVGCCGILGTVLAISSTSLIVKRKKKLNR